MKAENYVGIIRRVVPVSHVARSRRLKGDVDSYLAEADKQQDQMAKAKARKVVQNGNVLGTYLYTTEASESFFVDECKFDQKA